MKPAPTAPDLKVSSLESTLVMLLNWFLSSLPFLFVKTLHAETGAGISRTREILFLIHFFLPVAMGWSLAVVVSHAVGGSFSEPGLILLMAGIGAAYSLDRLVERELQSAWLTRALWCVLVFCGGVICITLAYPTSNPNLLKIVLILTAGSLLYTQLKKLPIAKTVIVAVSWTWACSTLPCPTDGNNWLSCEITLPLILLIASGCILCDLKDQHEDQHRGIPTLPVLLGVQPACLIATGMVVAAGAMAAIHRQFGLSVGATLLAIVAQFPSILSIRPLGAILVDAILTIPGILIAAGLF